MTDYFWTDLDQAQRRLLGTVILYDDQPHYVQDLIQADDPDECPRARLIDCAKPRDNAVRKMLNSPKFKKFRELPRIGWMNSTDHKELGAVLLQRRTRVTQLHGLTNDNILVHTINHTNTGDSVLNTGGFQFSNFRMDSGFVDAHHNHFPTLPKVLANIQEGSAIAICRKMAVVRDNNGVRWLFFGTNKVGIFTDADTLLLIAKFAFHREEIMTDAAFTCNNLREF